MPDASETALDKSATHAAFTSKRNVRACEANEAFKRRFRGLLEFGQKRKRALVKPAKVEQRMEAETPSSEWLGRTAEKVDGWAFEPMNKVGTKRSESLLGSRMDRDPDTRDLECPFRPDGSPAALQDGVFVWPSG
jgi:hypothetical protein